MKTQIQNLLVVLAIIGLVQSVGAQFTFTTNNGAITIAKYTGSARVVTIPDTTNGWPVVSIGTNAFRSSSVTSVTIPNSVTNIESYVFVDCFLLTNVVIGSNVTDIGQSVFYKCYGLTSITIPNSVTDIGSGAFMYCNNLTNVMLPSSMTRIKFDMFYECTHLAGIIIPNSVTNIEDAAFGFCINLTSVTIPKDVTYVGYSVFLGCTSLKAITVDAQNSVYISANGVLFDKNQVTLIEFPGGKVGGYAIPSSVKYIRDYAFEHCTSLMNVTIPNSVVTIGQLAFFYCTNLASAIIPNSVTYVGPSAFAYCAKLTSVAISNGITFIGAHTFGFCSSLTSVTIPESVTSIGGSAFEYCSHLTTLYFQGNPPSLGDANVFLSDTNLTIYYLPGTTYWDQFGNNQNYGYGGRPVVLWNPRPTTFDITGGHLLFNITGPTNAVIVVEACTNLVNPVWLPVSTNTLTDGTSSFSDSQSSIHPRRFYRFRSP